MGSAAAVKYPMPSLSYSDMTPEQRDKAFFIGVPLMETLQEASRHDIVNASYYLRGSFEGVLVEFARGDKIMVDITGDSHWAILKDVMRAIEKIYG